VLRLGLATVGQAQVTSTSRPGYRGVVTTQRRWTGSWLSGLPARPADDAATYPGERFGLPEEGTGSVATIGRRLLALLIDWLLCTVIALAFFHSRWWTLAIFAAETWLLTSLTGFTVGKRVLGIRVARVDGRPVGFAWFGWVLLRTLLLLAVLPALVTDRDLRGLHDRAANTIVIRT
jgi:RDD family